MTIEEIKRRIAEIEEKQNKKQVKSLQQKTDNIKVENIKNFSPSFLGL